MTTDNGRDAKSGRPADQQAEAAAQEGPAALDAKQREYDGLYDKYLRLLAEFDNYKKLAAKEREQYLQFGQEELLKEWLPVLDNIQRALSHAEEQRIADAVVQGWALILKQSQDVLSRAGVTAIDSVGHPFNPEWHQAIAQRESADAEEGVVMEEAQRGYLLKGKLLRPALVTVAKQATAAQAARRDAKA
jgi:molecular chaperone GrpE